MSSTLVPLRDLLRDADRLRLEAELAAKARSTHEIASCLVKGEYRSPQRAAAAANLASQRSGERIVAYWCRYCGFHHIGHSRPDPVVSAEGT